LNDWARNVGGGGGASIPKPLPGNSGFSFAFDVLGAAGRVIEELVIRLSPPGVRRAGNTDVLRQVPLLRALAAHDVPVAELVWFGDDGTAFGTAAIIQRRLRAKPLHMWDSSASVATCAGDSSRCLHEALQMLAAIHALDHRSLLDGWDDPRTTAQELSFWDRLLTKSGRESWLADQLRARLLCTDPGTHREGLFHGDYQTNNILYYPDGELVAVIDWEIAGIGPVGLDIGWLSMMTDPACWHGSHQTRMRVVAEPDELRRLYEQASGSDLPHYDWYRSLACYRFGCIAAFNLYLHQTGRRVDELYVAFAPSTDVLFRRGLELLG
jgi:aminoglycoside phosphotransferase (APT) family kinase protein